MPTRLSIVVAVVVVIIVVGDASQSAEDFADYVEVCDPDNYPDLTSLRSVDYNLIYDQLHFA